MDIYVNIYHFKLLFEVKLNVTQNLIIYKNRNLGKKYWCIKCLTGKNIKYVTCWILLHNFAW